MPFFAPSICAKIWRLQEVRGIMAPEIIKIEIRELDVKMPGKFTRPNTKHQMRGRCMQYRLTGAVVALMAVLWTVVPGHAQAQDQKRPDRIAGHPNLNGIWQALNTAYWNLEAHSAKAIPEFWRLGSLGAMPAGQSVVVGGKIPYKPGLRKKRDENGKKWPEADPAADCYMPGVPRANYMPYPFEIVQGDGNILFVYSFAKSNRIVHMKSHVDAPIDYWMGMSNGHWDGDTLVVKVIGNDDRTWLDRAGDFHSDKMTVTERFKLIDKNTLEYEATIDDPETFTKPWTIRMPLYRNVNPKARLLDFNCVEFSERLLYGHLEKFDNKAERENKGH